MNVNDAVVVQSQPFAECILCNLEAAVEVSFERSGKVKVQEECQIVLAEMFTQSIMQYSLSFEIAQYCAYLLLETTGGDSADAATVNGCILFIDAGREWKCQV